MKTKEELIKESWGGLWDNVKSFIDKNGFVEFPTNAERQDIFWKNGDYDYFQTEDRLGYNGESVGVQMFRPKSLAGIENNNGWIKIESEEDFPKEDCECWIFFPDNLDIMHAYFTIDYNVFTRDGHGNLYQRCFTHYQLIVKPKPPIY